MLYTQATRHAKHCRNGFNCMVLLLLNCEYVRVREVNKGVVGTGLEHSKEVKHGFAFQSRRLG